MRTVWKYDIPIDGQSHPVDIPYEHKIVHVDVQNVQRDCVTMWVEVYTNSIPTRYEFCVFGTGHELGEWVGEHVGTVLAGPFVWHLYEVK